LRGHGDASREWWRIAIAGPKLDRRVDNDIRNADATFRFAARLAVPVCRILGCRSERARSAALTQRIREASRRL